MRALAVDVQEKLLPPIFRKEQLVKNSTLLVRVAGILKMPVLVTTQYAKGLGGTVPEIASLLPETTAIDKQAFSCFGSEVFCSRLKRLPGHRTTLLLCGMESHICVMQTALDALRGGYLVHVASDAVAHEPSGIGKSVWNGCRQPGRLSHRPKWRFTSSCGPRGLPDLGKCCRISSKGRQTKGLPGAANPEGARATIPTAGRISPKSLPYRNLPATSGF